MTSEPMHAGANETFNFANSVLSAQNSQVGRKPIHTTGPFSTIIVFTTYLGSSSDPEEELLVAHSRWYYSRAKEINHWPLERVFALNISCGDMLCMLKSSLRIVASVFSFAKIDSLKKGDLARSSSF